MPAGRLFEKTTLPGFTMQGAVQSLTTQEDKLPASFKVECMDQHTLMYAAVENTYNLLRTSGSGPVSSLNLAGFVVTIAYVDDLIEYGQLGDDVYFHDCYLLPQSSSQLFCSTQDCFESPARYPIATKTNRTIHMTRDPDFNEFLCNTVRGFSSYSHDAAYQAIDYRIKSVDAMIECTQSTIFPQLYHHTETAGLYQLHKKSSMGQIVKQLKDKSTILGVIINCYTKRCMCIGCQINLVTTHLPYTDGFIHKFTQEIQSAKEKELRIPNNGLFVQSFVTADQPGKGTVEDHSWLLEPVEHPQPVIRLFNSPSEGSSITDKTMPLIIQGHVGALGIIDRVKTAPQREALRIQQSQLNLLKISESTISDQASLWFDESVQSCGQSSAAALPDTSPAARFSQQDVVKKWDRSLGLGAFANSSPSTSSVFEPLDRSSLGDENETNQDQQAGDASSLTSPQKRMKTAQELGDSHKKITPSKGNFSGLIFCSSHDTPRLDRRLFTEISTSPYQTTPIKPH